MALANRVLTDWLGDPGAVLETSVRRRGAVHVPDDDSGVEIVVVAPVAAHLPGKRARSLTSP